MRQTLLCLLWVTLGVGCKYDLGKIYDYPSSDASSPGEGGAGGLPDQLIDLFSSEKFVDAACRACANKKCARSEATCREDQDCMKLLACAAEEVNPDKLSSCRADHAAWCAEDVIGRGLGGPFYTCVFRDSCAEECDTPSDWSCLGKYTWEATPQPSVPVRIRFSQANANVDTPAVGITVKVFTQLGDVKPAITGKTDKNGLVSLDLPTPITIRKFFGFIQIEGEGWYPTLVQFGYPIARENVISMPIVTQEQVNGSVLSSGVQQQADRGLLQLRMFGCAGVLMSDVSFATDMTDSQTRTWYYDGQTADTMRTKTTKFGNGGIVNVLPGSRLVTATLDGKRVAATSAPVRAGFLTIVLLAPLDTDKIDQ